MARGLTAGLAILGAVALLGACHPRDADEAPASAPANATAPEATTAATPPPGAAALSTTGIEQRAQELAARRQAQVDAESALATAPEPAEGDATAATALPNSEDDAPPAPPSGPNATGPGAPEL